MRRIRPKKQGKLISNNVVLEKHEMETVVFLLMRGFDVELMPPSCTPQSKTADIFMLGKYWEIKSPIGKTQRTLEHLVKKAAHQANNVIIDLNRTSISSHMAIAQLEILFYKFRSIRNLWIIDNESLIKLKK